MNSKQNKMNNSSCSNNGGKVEGRLDNSSIDSTRNQGDMREIRNLGDLREVTDKSGSMNRHSMTDS